MTAILELEAIACPLGGTPEATLLCSERDLALGVPGHFPLARCERCELLYQNPRVRRRRMVKDSRPGSAAGACWTSAARPDASCS